MAEDDDEMLLMTRSLNVTPKTTQHLIVLSDKSVACLNVTNNKRLRSTFCTTELPTDGHEASHGLFAPLYRLHSTPLLGRSPSEYRHKV